MPASHGDLPWEESTSPAGLELLDTSKALAQIPGEKGDFKSGLFYICSGTDCYGRVPEVLAPKGAQCNTGGTPGFHLLPTIIASWLVATPCCVMLLLGMLC